VQRPSDFRSDTVTRPTKAMLAAMFAAELGDDVLEGDPTVRRLEHAFAAWVGKEEALYLPSGTMANQVAIGAWTRPGDELVAERSAHVVQWEAGAAAALHGVQVQTLRAPDGRLDPAEIAAAIRIDSIHCPKMALVCVEQTFMGDGDGPGGASCRWRTSSASRPSRARADCACTWTARACRTPWRPRASPRRASRAAPTR
jgi:threonine aldolase